jgi:hypothetical protein
MRTHTKPCVQVTSCISFQRDMNSLWAMAASAAWSNSSHCMDPFKRWGFPEMMLISSMKAFITKARPLKGQRHCFLCFSKLLVVASGIDLPSRTDGSLQCTGTSIPIWATNWGGNLDLKDTDSIQGIIWIYSIGENVPRYHLRVKVCDEGRCPYVPGPKLLVCVCRRLFRRRIDKRSHF